MVKGTSAESKKYSYDKTCDNCGKTKHKGSFRTGETVCLLCARKKKKGYYMPPRTVEELFVGDSYAATH